jgi:hypothetical protein
MSTTSRTQGGHGITPGETTTVRGLVPDHSLSSIWPVSRERFRRLEIGEHSLSQVGACLPAVCTANSHAPDRSTTSGVLDQDPGHRPTVVGRHHVVLSDGRPSGRESDHLPDSALRTSLARASPRAEGFPRHASPSFPLKGGEYWDALTLIASRTSRNLTVDIEPRGSLFADRCVPVATRTTAGRCKPGGSFLPSARGRVNLILPPFTPR